MSAVDLFIARASTEEGVRIYCYDDATGNRVHAPVGNITWGIGFNLEACGSLGLFQAMLVYIVDKLETQIEDYPWYASADDTRKSVFLDIGFNQGIAGLLAYPNMLAAAEAGNWVVAAQECAVADPKLDASRYAPLRVLLINGDPP